jgi:hypothetical protein
MLNWRTVLCATAAAVLVSGASAKEPLRLKVAETPLTSKPLPKPVNGQLENRVSDDASKIAYVMGDGQHEWVMVNHERIMPQTAKIAHVWEFSHSGRLAYTFRESDEPNMLHVVFDGKVSRGFQALLTLYDKAYTVFSNDGNHMLTIMMSLVQGAGADPNDPTTWREEDCLLYDGQEYPSCTNFYSPVISADSKRWGYIGLRDDGFSWVIDGVKQKAYPHMVNCKAIFSANSEGVAYLAQTEKMRMIPVVNGVEVGVYNNIDNIVLSPDGKHYAFVATNGADQSVIIDGKEEHGIGAASNLIYTGDNKLARIVAKDGKLHLLLDKVESKEEYPAGSDLIVASPKLGRLAVGVCQRNGDKTRSGWVIDGKAGEMYDGLMEGEMFSPSGKNFAFRVRRADSKWYYVALGKVFPVMEGEIREPQFSPDETRFVVASKWQNVNSLALDGQAMGDFDYLGHINFTPDSQHLVYTAAKTKDSPVNIVIDDAVVKGAYDEVRSCTFFTGPDSFRVILYRDMVPIRVDVTILGGPVSASKPATTRPTLRPGSS